MNKDGDILSSYKIGGNGDDSGGDLIQLDDDDYVVLGHTNSFGHGGYDAWLLKLSILENNPPNKPSKPTGSTSIKVGTSYTYETSTSDTEGDPIYYWFDWGDNTTTEWTAFSNSGAPVKLSHTWTAKGDYTVKCKAKDLIEKESDWGTLTVSMPCSYTIPFMPFWTKLVERFPNAFPLLRQLLGY